APSVARSDAPVHEPRRQLCWECTAPEGALFTGIAWRSDAFIRQICNQRQRRPVTEPPFGEDHGAITTSGAEACAGKPRHELASADGEEVAYEAEPFASRWGLRRVPVENCAAECRLGQWIGNGVAVLRVGLRELPAAAAAHRVRKLALKITEE